MSAITQFPVVTGKALQTASRKAEEALRTAADQMDIVRRAAAESPQRDLRAARIRMTQLLEAVGRVQMVRDEILRSIHIEAEAPEGAAPPGSQEPAGGPGKRSTRLPAAPKSPAPDEASARGEAWTAFEALLRTGALLNSARFQQRAGVSRQALSKAVGAGRLFYVEAGAMRGYPSFYLDPTLQRKQVEAVCRLLGDLPGGSKWLFFTTPKASLARPSQGVPRTPLEALAQGDFERVKTAAIGFAQR